MRAPATRPAVACLLLLALLVAGATAVHAQAPGQGGTPPATGPLADAPGGPCDVIHAIEVRGNRKMSADAVRFDLGIRPGDRWDDARIRREFRRFWKRGYFSDLRFFRRCTPEGAVLVIVLRERPTILSISYDRLKMASQQQIEDYFKERNFRLSVGAPLDRKKLWRARQLIREFLGQKGYLDAEVVPEVSTLSPGAVKVHFRIRPGGKTKIRKIEFTGNEAFSDRKLRKRFKLTSTWHWYWPFSKKALYHPLKYQQDITNILQFYRDHGYLDVDVRPPIVRVVTRESRRENGDERRARRHRRRRKKKEDDRPVDTGPRVRKWVYLTIPVVEGPVYHLGEVRFEGNTVFTDKQLRPFVPLAPGSVIRDNVIEAGIDMIRRAYGTKGYVYATVTRRFERHEGEPVADLVISIDEDQAYTVRRIEFRGNTETRDLVLRRELNIYEGELLNKAQLDRSMQKLNMLGYWVPEGEPTLEPVPGEPLVDVIIHGQEQSRNEIQVGGGYSELEGGFFLASYQTRNFLGRGETLSLYLGVGSRMNQASIAFTEPWFLGKPYTFGFRIYRRSFDFGRALDAQGNLIRLTQSATGGAVTIGKRIGDFTQVQLTYGYETTDADTLDISARYATTNTRIATLTPVFSFRRLDNFLRPTRGAELTLIGQVAARSLGGDNDYIRPQVEGSVYFHVVGRWFVALHGELGWIKPFGEIHREPGFVDGVPRFQRFFLGGDTIGPRVFETRTISPIRWIVQVDVNGNPVVDGNGNPLVYPAWVGGSKKALFQFELGYPIGRTATLAFFFDAGGVYDNGVDINVGDMRMSTGVEFRVFMPMFQAPIRLIYGWPVREFPGDRTNTFQFSIGLPF